MDRRDPMSANPSEPAAVRRLDVTVLEYSSGPFDLGNDLRHLDRVRSVGAPEATIFYSARILEALTADALETAGLPTSPIVLSNLVLLQQFNLIPTTTRYWAHALRRLGNLVRHLHGRVTTDDAHLALEFVERMLKWFFCDLGGGRRLSAITVDGGPIWQDVHPELQALMQLFDDPKFDPIASVRQMEDNQTSALLSTPALPAVLADMLLDHDECPAARKVLDEARALFPSDVRLQQLMGLLHSRTGELNDALKYLEPLYEKSTDDEETAGILGGIYKRFWQHEGTKTDWLAKSHRAYRRGWDRSKGTSAYLGINAATTALWLGHTNESREIAEKVRDLLRRRADAIHATIGLVFNYWDQVTLAEAELLSGNLAEARELYCDAFGRHASQRGDLKVSQTQLGAILPRLGISASPEEFLRHEASES